MTLKSDSHMNSNPAVTIGGNSRIHMPYLITFMKRAFQRKVAVDSFQAK